MHTEHTTTVTTSEATLANNGREIASWARFLSISGFVISVVLIMVAIFGGSILHSLEQASVDPSRKAGTFSLTVMVGAAVIFFLSLHLFRFARNIGNGTDKLKFSRAFLHLKIFFRTLGCLFILLIGYFLWQVAMDFINL